MTAQIEKKKPASFEEGMKELEALIERLHMQELPLHESIDLYEQGAALCAQLEEQLAAQRRRIEVIDPDTAEIGTFEERGNSVS